MMDNTVYPLARTAVAIWDTCTYFKIFYSGNLVNIEYHKEPSSYLEAELESEDEHDEDAIAPASLEVLISLFITISKVSCKFLPSFTNESYVFGFIEIVLYFSDINYH